MGGRGAYRAGQDRDKLIDWLSGESGTGSGVAQPRDISKFEDWSLEQVEDRLRNLAHEELFVLDKNNKVIKAYRGDSNSVTINASDLDIADATVTHGHPKGAAEFGGTFFADVNNMLNSKWSEHRATVSGQGEMNYIMRATNKANPQGLRNKINSDFQGLRSSVSKKYDSEYAKSIKSGTTEKQARHNARQQSVGILNRYYKDTFSQYGYDYITKKKAYKYNR